MSDLFRQINYTLQTYKRTKEQRFRRAEAKEVYSVSTCEKKSISFLVVLFSEVCSKASFCAAVSVIVVAVAYTCFLILRISLLELEVQFEVKPKVYLRLLKS